MNLQVKVAEVTAVQPHGENLSLVEVNGQIVVANRLEDGSFRWTPGEWCVYVPENAIVPDDVLKERGYWNDEKNKGLLGGSKGNRVKMQRFAGVESRGLVFKIQRASEDWYSEDPKPQLWRGLTPETEQSISVEMGQDVAEFLGITEYVPQ